MPFNIHCINCGYYETAHGDSNIEDSCEEYRPDLEEAEIEFVGFVERFNPGSMDDDKDYDLWQRSFHFTSEVIQKKIEDPSINYKIDLGELLSDMGYRL